MCFKKPWTFYKVCNTHTQIWGVSYTFTKILPSYHGAFSVGQFACGQNIKNMSCLNWGPAGKKVHICDLLPTSVSTRVQIVQTLCEGRELTFILLQSLMSWVMIKQMLTFFLDSAESSRDLTWGFWLRIDVFLNLFDPLDSLCGCGLEAPNHESTKELWTPKPSLLQDAEFLFPFTARLLLLCVPWSSCSAD